MPIVVTCHSCGKTLKAPDRLAGRKAKCASCGSIVVVHDVSIPEAILVSGPKAKPKPKLTPVAQDEEPVWAVPVMAESPRQETGLAGEEDDIVDAEPAEIVNAEPDEIAEAEPAEEDPARAGERRRPRRKKKRRPRQPDEIQSPGWIRWYVGLGALVLVYAICAVIAASAGLWPFMIVRGIGLAILFPFSLIILIASMFISSYFAGGIDFGEVQTAIPKAIILLILVDSVLLIPIYGMFLTFPVWIFGLIGLFRLDIWEARMMFLINWALNCVVRFFVLAFILSIIQHATSDKDVDDPQFDRPPAIQQDDDEGFPGPRQAPFQENAPRFQNETGDFPPQPKAPARSQPPKKTRTTGARQPGTGP
jgi:hypothetical protein